ncbi:DNA polymerase III subunit delta [Bacteroides caecigallinarum]|uniref:DNA polymerase III subunit delta n=1 Tax=Bacteroides caecigallinarum TaxID=1411144 RepID=UPI001F2275A7|nr:DNA polymerase III subunit delta [Bacteroides caecigallinarum]MCF2738012.1 DNA polymerase III subunit delta [Bacteroides caecigallinarum]MDN0053127.1 DNA polymerase III subunit delta [Bacteroides caecigallinarum]MDN0071241.1 DNA polymerase III subunit delta [Bacteroides caecigallinarum]
MTYEDIAKDIKNGKFAPVYLLMGEEDYYIDRISDYIVEKALDENEKEFNLTIMYGLDTDMASVVNNAKRYPMMSEHQVVVVKEAQNLRSWEELSFYMQKPLTSTILVFCYKHGTLDRRKKIVAEIEKNGVVFESKKLKENLLPGFITAYMKRRKMEIDDTAAQLMAEFVGNDLNRLAGELDKLIITMPKDRNRITPVEIERNIGISKDYNNFELKNALITKDTLKANKIVKYFSDNPKSNPLQPTLALLFNYFSNLMVAYYAPERTENGVAAYLGLKSPWLAKEYIAGMKAYTGVKVMNIITQIRLCDARSKGIGNVSLSPGELLRELVYFILH